MKRKPQYMVCSLASGPNHVPSHRKFCSGCGAGVWVSKASQELAEEYNVTIICTECATKLENPVFAGIGRGQLDEIVRNVAN
jgi:hypothetical protein